MTEKKCFKEKLSMWACFYIYVNNLIYGENFLSKVFHINEGQIEWKLNNNQAALMYQKR